jgi:hypothetical protein
MKPEHARSSTIWCTARFRYYAKRVRKVLHRLEPVRTYLIAQDLLQEWCDAPGGLAAVLPSVKELDLRMSDAETPELDYHAIQLLSLRPSYITARSLPSSELDRLFRQICTFSQYVQMLDIDGDAELTRAVDDLVLDRIDFSDMTALKELYLYQIPISWKALHAILDLPEFKILILRWCGSVTNIPAQMPVLRAPLHTLSLQDCPAGVMNALHQKQLKVVTWHMPQLPTLDDFNGFWDACTRHKGIQELYLRTFAGTPLTLSELEVGNIIFAFSSLLDLTNLALMGVRFPEIGLRVTELFAALPARLKEFILQPPLPAPWPVFQMSVEKFGHKDGALALGLVMNESPPSEEWVRDNVKIHTEGVVLDLSGDPGSVAPTWAAILGYMFPNIFEVRIAKGLCTNQGDHEALKRVQSVCSLMGVGYLARMYHH